MKRVIKAKVRSKEQAAKEFIKSWHELESSNKEKPVSRPFLDNEPSKLKNNPNKTHKRHQAYGH